MFPLWLASSASPGARSFETSRNSFVAVNSNRRSIQNGKPPETMRSRSFTSALYLMDVWRLIEGRFEIYINGSVLSKDALKTYETSSCPLLWTSCRRHPHDPRGPIRVVGRLGECENHAGAANGFIWLRGADESIRECRAGPFRQGTRATRR